MEFRILGPLEADEQGASLRLGSPKQRALLALLLLERGQVAARDRLIEDLWHGDPPAAAAATLHAYLSRLRSILGADRLQTRAPGYRLAFAPDELDANRFEQLLDEGRRALADGRPGAAAEALGDALALWRGSPLADLSYEPFAQAEIARLEELQVAAREELVDAQLALGRHADLTGELESLVAEHPLRERLRAQHMLALYRSGRQAEALDSYAEARRLLTEELGLEPGETLKGLQRAILVHDPALERQGEPEPPSEETSSGTGASTSFVGRERELGELRRGLAEALGGRGRLFLLSGEPGIGKSRLAERLASLARERDALVLVGRCWEAGGAPAYWPWVQALRSYLRDREPQVLRRQLGRGAPELAQILPELETILPDITPRLGSEPEAARFRLFDATASFLIEAARAQPLVLILDDLHAADTPSLLLLQFLAGMIAESRLLVLCAYRDIDPTVRDPLSTTLTELVCEPVTRPLPLTGLREEDVARYIELTTSSDSPAGLAAAIYRETEGNPLFVGEVVRLLVTEAALEDAAGTTAWRLTVPEGVRAVIRRRLRHLSDDCKLVLVLASVLGREFAVDALEQASGVSGDSLLDILDEAVRERVVTEVPGAQGRLRFAHALIRDTLYDELAPGRRAQLERRVGEALEALYGSERDRHLAELAHHFLAAAPAGGGDKAIEYASRAGDRAVELIAFEEAARLYEDALSMKPADGVRCNLLLALGDAQARAGERAAAKSTFLQAAELADSLGLPEQLARAALGYGGRLIWEVSRDDENLAMLLEKALDVLPTEDSPLRVRLLARLAAGPLRDSTADAERRRSLGIQALEMARRIGAPPTLAYALEGFIASHHAPSFTPRQLVLAEELVRVALDAGEPERAVEGYESLLQSCIELGDTPRAYSALDAMMILAAELRQPAQLWLGAVNRALLALLEGRFDEAEGLVAEALAVGEPAQPWSASVTHGLQLLLLRREQGRAREVEELVRRSAAKHPTYPIWRCALASVLAELGSSAEARTELGALSADRFAAVPFDEEWTVSMCFLAEASVQLDDRARASIIYQLLLPYSDRVAVSYPEISTGPVARYLGLLASTMARWDDAELHFLRAVELSARIGARPSLAHTEEGYARMLLDRGGAHRNDKVRALLDRAVTAYRELGMTSHLERAAALGELVSSQAPAGRARRDEP